MKASTQNTISTNESRYKCDLCRDTTWIKGDSGMKRCNCFKNESIERLWKNFGVNLSDIKLIKEYKAYSIETEKARNKSIIYIKDFHIRRLQKEHSICFLGQSGAGKTHLALAIGKALIDKKQKVVYMPYLEVIKELKNLALDKVEYEKTILKYKNADVLIIDDLFKDKVRGGKLIGELTEADLKHIYTIINYRYLNKMPLIISSECSPEMLLDLDEATGGRILEMAGPKGTIIFNGQSNYRLRKFMKED